MQSNAAILADAIMALSVVGDDGKMSIPTKESLAEACKMELHEVWYDIDDALKILVSEGMVTKRGFSYYLTEEYERYVRMLEQAIAESEQKRADETQSYDLSAMGEVL